MKSIKEFPIRIITPKGKRKGRPNKAEVYLSELVSNAYLEHKEKIDKAVTDNILYGKPFCMDEIFADAMLKARETGE